MTHTMTHTMDVLGVGMGRTGTNSLKLALEELGFGPCYHMKEVMDRPERSKTWRRVLDGAPADWDTLYHGYHSTVDWPGAYYWRELVDAYPKAKVILSVRDPERWVDSMYKTIFRWPLRRPNWSGRLGFALLHVVAPSSMAEARMLDRVFDRTFQRRHFNRPADREIAIQAFLKHNEEVKAYVPADRLLVYQISDGWEPLCAFLGVPVPDKPFPRVNDAKEFQDDIAGRIKRYTIRITVGVAATLTVAMAVGLALAFA